jgi:hypothetical protein
VVEIATDNLAALPADWAHEYFGLTIPASVFSRAWLIMSLAELGSFAEAAGYEVEVIRLAESTQHVFAIGWAYFAASMLHLLKGDWARARSLVEHWIAMLRAANAAIQLPWAVAACALVLASSASGARHWTVSGKQRNSSSMKRPRKPSAIRSGPTTL